MGHKLKLDVTGFMDLYLEIKDSSTTLDEGHHQCWCVKLNVYWQTMAIEGWAFLSSWWGELIFQKVYDGQPPHFISGKPIETDFDNDMLWEFADDIGASPQALATAIFKTLGEVMFVMPPLRLIGNEFTIDQAMSYRHANMIHRIQAGGQR